MDAPTQTAEDRAWFNEPVTINIEQDNQAWLDTMTEMKKEELINYAVFNYGLPEAAAQVVGRNDLISMIVTANKAGGGQAVSRTEYLYIKELKGIIEPAVSLFNPEDDPLFLVRGSGNAQQIYDKVKDEWFNLVQLKAEHAKNVAATRGAASAAADAVAGHPSFAETTPPAPVKPTLSEGVLSVLPTLKRADLAAIGKDLGIDDLMDQEIYGSNDDVRRKIYETNTANKGE